MDILIESGATKSTCVGYRDTSVIFSYKTTGINATYTIKEDIFVIFEEIIDKNSINTDNIENIRYYGAGCFNTKNSNKVKAVLRELFPQANIAVFSDLYAACHALCNRKKGFVGILGTGAASCFYNETTIERSAPSLGWLLGDEGSGAYLGKQFIKEYLSDTLETEIAEDFEKTFSITKATTFEKVYQKQKPQVFFASIPIFLQKHLENKQIKILIEDSFQAFFDKQTDYYATFPYPWFFCGSIAYYFQDILMKTAHKNQVTIEKIIPESIMYLLNL